MKFFNNMNHSESHKNLVLKYESILNAQGFDTILYGRYMGKRPNILYLKNNSIQGIAECIVSRILMHAERKLESFPNDIEKVVVRWEKPRNPKADAAIMRMNEKGIRLTELEHE